MIGKRRLERGDNRGWGGRLCEVNLVESEGLSRGDGGRSRRNIYAQDQGASLEKRVRSCQSNTARCASNDGGLSEGWTSVIMRCQWAVSDTAAAPKLW